MASGRSRGFGRDPNLARLFADDADRRRLDARQLAEELPDGGRILRRVARLLVWRGRCGPWPRCRSAGTAAPPGWPSASAARSRRTSSATWRAQRASIGVDLVEDDEPASVSGEEALAVCGADQEVFEHLVIGQQEVGRAGPEARSLLFRGPPVVHGHPDRVAVARIVGDTGGSARAGRWPARSWVEDEGDQTRAAVVGDGVVDGRLERRHEEAFGLARPGPGRHDQGGRAWPEEVLDRLLLMEEGRLAPRAPRQRVGEPGIERQVAPGPPRLKRDVGREIWLLRQEPGSIQGLLQPITQRRVAGAEFGPQVVAVIG